MIKLTNAQAAAFNMQTISQLFGDASRAFPVKDGFALMDMINQAQQRHTTYRDQTKQIIAKHKGDVDNATGRVTYPDKSAEEAAVKEVSELNEATFEIHGEAVTLSDDWPRLTLLEMSVLKPLIKMR